MGILEPETIEAPFHCPSGECIFEEPYHSIGLCSRCFDASANTTEKCRPNPKHVVQSHKQCRRYLHYQEFENGDIMNVSAGFPITVSKPYDYSGGLNWTLISIAAVKAWADPVSIKEYRGTSQADGKISTYHLVSAIPPLSVSCQVYICVNTYKATIEQNKLKESILSTTAIWMNDTVIDFNSMVLVDCLSSETREYISKTHYSTRHPPQWMPWNGMYLNGTEQDEGISSRNTSAIPDRCVYQWLWFQADDKLTGGSKFLTSLYGDQMNDNELNLSNVSDSNDAITNNYSGDENILQENPIVLNDYIVPNYEDDILAILYHNQNISLSLVESFFKNYTTSLTNLLRRIYTNRKLRDLWLSDKNETWYQLHVPLMDRTPAEGITLVAATCIQVRWAWIALPGCLMLATALFFAAIVRQSAPQANHSMWKLSPLAPLWHGLEGTSEQESVWLNRKDEMKTRAKEIHVRLRTTDKGWKLAQTNDLNEWDKS